MGYWDDALCDVATGNSTPGVPISSPPSMKRVKVTVAHIYPDAPSGFLTSSAAVLLLIDGRTPPPAVVTCRGMLSPPLPE